MRPDIDPTAAAFGVIAADYERARPSYPPAALEALRCHLGIGTGCRVLDLAAGTGKLTRLLAGAGADVVAVEPVDGMRDELAQAVPDVEVVHGTAEEIPLPDSSVDAVTVAQAFHWFRADEALAEIRRVLRPGGGLAILFNQRDEREPYVRAWNDVIGWHSQRIARYEHIDWSAVLGGGGFEEVGSFEVEWNQPMTRELVAARVRSVSYVAQCDEAEQQRYVDAVVALVEGLDEPFDLPYVTRIWWASKPR